MRPARCLSQRSHTMSDVPAPALVPSEAQAAMIAKICACLPLPPLAMRVKKDAKDVSYKSQSGSTANSHDVIAQLMLQAVMVGSKVRALIVAGPGTAAACTQSSRGSGAPAEPSITVFPRNRSKTRAASRYSRTYYQHSRRTCALLTPSRPTLSFQDTRCATYRASSCVASALLQVTPRKRSEAPPAVCFCRPAGRLPV